MPWNANAKKTAKKPSKLAWWAAHVRRQAVVLAAGARPVAALVAGVRGVVTQAAMAVDQVAIAVKVAEAVAKSHERCTKNAWLFEGNPLKQLK